jgi:hypothetical protein
MLSVYSPYIRTDLFSVYEQFHSVYSECMNRFIQYAQQNSIEYLPNSAYSPNMYRFTLRILSIRTDSFPKFSLYAQIHVAHSANVPEHF